MDKVREAIAAGRPSFGSWLSIADPVAAELVGKAGFDFVIADTQHGGVTWENLLSRSASAGTRRREPIGARRLE